MNKKLMIIIVAIIIVVAALIVGLFYLNRELELPELTTEDISRVYFDTFNDNKINLDIEEFLGYYNQIHDLRNNSEGEGSTETRRIVIELKDGEEITILNFGDQFEICFNDRDGERHQYWGKQQEIANMLYHGVYGLK